MRPAAVHHHGVVVALSDAIQCPGTSPEQWSCSLLPGHEGDHVAFCFDERTGLPEREPVAVWGDDRLGALGDGR